MSHLKNNASKKVGKKAVAARSREAAMAKDLKEAGWVQTPSGQWKICLYYETNQIIKTLHQAHKLQMKLNSIQKEIKE